MISRKRTQAQVPKNHRSELKNPRRQQRCEQSLSRKATKGQRTPADRGACEPKSTTQGSE